MRIVSDWLSVFFGTSLPALSY